MPLIKTIKATEKTKLSITVSKKLAEDFENELKIFTANFNNNVSLDFDNFAKKLIAELKQINKKSELNIEEKPAELL
jgi:transposase-like protein